RRQRGPQPDPGHGAHLLRLLDLLGAPGGWTARLLEGAVRAQGRVRRGDEDRDGGGVLRLGLPGDRLHPLHARLAQLPPLRERFRGREHARGDVDDGSPPRLAVAGSLLSPGAARGPGPGARLHVVDRCFHAADLSAGTRKGRNPMNGSITVGLAALGAAIGVGLIGMGSSAAVGRNPGAATKVMVQSILSIAFAEAIVFYALFLVR